MSLSQSSSHLQLGGPISKLPDTVKVHDADFLQAMHIPGLLQAVAAALFESLRGIDAFKKCSWRFPRIPRSHKRES